MIAVVQRVFSSSVDANGHEAGRIGQGLLVLLGVMKEDEEKDLDYIVRKVAGLRIFDNGGKMDLSVSDIGGEILVVSQFTLAGDARRGNRPDFSGAAQAVMALYMYRKCIKAFRSLGIKASEGEFGASMKIDASLDGPVTILLNSKRAF